MRMDGRFGRFGGAYVPEILVPALEQLESAFLDAQQDADFNAELSSLLSTYAGRPTPITVATSSPLWRSTFEPPIGNVSSGP